MLYSLYPLDIRCGGRSAGGGGRGQSKDAAEQRLRMLQAIGKGSSYRLKQLANGLWSVVRK